jgi:Ca-activated chloride channel homolog
MRGHSLYLGIALSALSIGVSCPQTTTQNPTAPYTISVPADEVSLTFHASDFNNIPISDLQLSDLRLLDNGRQPRKILAFDSHLNLPIRAGILMDTSRSMLHDLRLNRIIATTYTQHLLHQQTDLAFIMRFDSQWKVLQDWTADEALLDDGIGHIASDQASRLGGTVIFDAIYTACRDQFGKVDTIPTGNFILVFSDGEDNASHARLSDDIDICQQNHTAIYVFSNETKSHFPSAGQKTLIELSSKSGGRVFYDQTETGIMNDLRIIEADQRSQYRLVYKPSNLKPDGSFHHIKLDSPTRGGIITVRSGYYAPHSPESKSTR